VLLLDEPTASLDPQSTQKVEELVYELRSSMTVIIVTHNMQQAARVSDRTVFMLSGEMVEVAPTRAVFTAPSDPRTEAYITGRFG
jgi:phosphate transport system ATP-binding protein